MILDLDTQTIELNFTIRQHLIKSVVMEGKMANVADREPFPTDPDEFENDDRISFDKVSQTHKLEDDNGEEWEWLARPGKWVPVVRNFQIPVLSIDRLSGLRICNIAT